MSRSLVGCLLASMIVAFAFSADACDRGRWVWQTSDVVVAPTPAPAAQPTPSGSRSMSVEPSESPAAAAPVVIESAPVYRSYSPGYENAPSTVRRPFRYYSKTSGHNWGWP